MKVCDNKILWKLHGTHAKPWYFPQKMPKIQLNTLPNTPDRYREGGRTVGSGRVASIIE